MVALFPNRSIHVNGIFKFHSMKNQFLSFLLSEQEIQNFTKQVDQLSDDDLLRALLSKQYMLEVDWKGGETRFNIGKFLEQRAAMLGTNIDLDLENTYPLAEQDAKEPGDFIPALLSRFQKTFKREGINIVLLDRGNDSYYIVVALEKDTKLLQKSSDDFWRFNVFGSLRGEVLYTVNCTCGSMNVWQLKRGEPLTDDVCQDCGKVLFDKAGNATLPVIRDYC